MAGLFNGENGTIKKVLTTAGAIILAAFIIGGWNVYVTVNTIDNKFDTMIERVNRIDERVRYLERRGGPDER